MKHYLEYKDEKSDKFWEISMTEGAKSFSVRYGKIGSDGTINTKEFENSEKALKEAEKLLSEKLKKGYNESNGGNTPKVSTSNAAYLTEWNNIVKSSNMKVALIEHFKILTEGEDSQKLLEEVMDKATQVEIADECFVIHFGNEYTMTCTSPSTVKPKKSVPKSYAEILKLHSNISLDGPDIPLTFAGVDEKGDLYGSEFIHEAEEFLDVISAKGVEPENVFLALYNHQDELIFHPIKKSKAKEMAVCHLRHDDCEVSKPLSLEWNFAEIFLGMIASDVLDRDCFEDVPDKKIEKSKNAKKPTISALSSQEAMEKADWKEQVLLFLDLDRSYLEDWQGIRKSMVSICEKVLSLPVAITHKDWSELVRLIIDQTVKFSEYSEEIYGESVDPEEDEGGLIESYSDDEMYTTDLVMNLLSISETQKVSTWKDLVIHTFKIKDDAMGYMSNCSEEVKAFMSKEHVKSHPEYAKILKIAKKAYPFDVSS